MLSTRSSDVVRDSPRAWGLSCRLAGEAVEARSEGTLCDLLEHWGVARASEPALVFLADGEVESERWSFGRLLKRSRAIAATLEPLAERGERVLLAHPPSPEFVASLLGCLMAGAVATPVAPPRRRDDGAALEGIVRDAGAAVALASAGAAGSLRDVIGRTGSRAVVVDTGEVSDRVGEGWRRGRLIPADLALLQYTSGSTGRPRGVEVTHANLIANQAQIARAFGHDEQTTIVTWLPMFHDMGLIGNVMQPLFLGRPNYVMPARRFLERPARWLRLISSLPHVTSGAPDFAYELCVRRITGEQRRGLDLSGWRVAYSGAEPVRAETLDRFTEAFGSCGFRRRAFLPCYGLAEATLLVSGGPGPGRSRERRLDPGRLEKGEVVDSPHGRRIVGCGQVAPGSEVVAVDPDTARPAPSGRVGELWVRGPSVARGYRGRGAPFAFGARLRHLSHAFLRTGDLGFVEDGEVFVTGRLKDVIIVRGRNHHPHDLEQTAGASHPALERGAAAAFALDDERLVIAQEIRREAWRSLDAPAVATALRRAVTLEHGLAVADVVLLRPGSVPRTTSGKVRRREARRRYVSGELETRRMPDAEREA